MKAQYSKIYNEILIKRRIVIVLLFIIVIQLFSCKKYLEEKQNNSIAVPTRIEDLQALLDDASEYMNHTLTPCFGEVSSDNLFLLQNNYDTRPDFEKLFYVWKPAEYFFPNDWSKSYTPVYNSNYCLEMIEKIPITSQNADRWNNVKGSALFYRSYNFLNLVWNYGKAYDENTSDSDLGIVLRLGSDFNKPSIRASVKQCYERIITDTRESIQYLPGISLHVYRPSRAAAYGLLARAYLSMRKYDSALHYSNLCLQIKSELINCNGDAEFLNTTSGPSFVRFNKETIFYTEMYNFISIISNVRAKVDVALHSSYASNDWRRTAFFEPNSGYYRFRGSYAQSGGIYFTGLATDEMYLIRAECYTRRNQPGDIDFAIADLNTLLEKRYKPPFVPVTATDATDALNKILTERRKELLFRGLRWIDIKRLNKEGANIVLTRVINGETHRLQPNSNYYALPLPADIIAITGMEQNPL